MRRPPVLVLAAMLVASAACSGKDPYNPGTPMGTFNVQGKLTTNSCGDAGSAPDPWAFDVKLSRDASTLYWLQGGPPVSGVLDASTHATLKSSDTRTVHAANPRSGVSFCAMTRDDILDATLSPAGTGNADAFNGSLTYRFTPTEDSDCSDQMAGSGGEFAALPCEVKYDLAALHTDKK